MTVHERAGTMADTGTRPRPTGPTAEPPVLGGPEHTDYYLLNDLLTDEQRALRQRVRSFMDREVLPIINPVLGARGVPPRAGSQAGGARDRGFPDPGLRQPGDEQRDGGAGHPGAGPR